MASKQKKTEDTEKTFTMSDMLDAQMEVNNRLRTESEQKKNENTTELQKLAKGAEDKAKTLSDENNRLKLLVDELKENIKRLERDLASEKAAAKKSRQALK